VVELAFRAMGVLSIFIISLALVWILFRSRRRLQRISAALAIWFLFSLALYLFRGSLF
jgi:cbb3-type cytochrome oxidase subunit 3